MKNIMIILKIEIILTSPTTITKIQMQLLHLIQQFKAISRTIKRIKIIKQNTKGDNKYQTMAARATPTIHRSCPCGAAIMSNGQPNGLHNGGTCNYRGVGADGNGGHDYQLGVSHNNIEKIMFLCKDNNDNNKMICAFVFVVLITTIYGCCSF